MIKFFNIIYIENKKIIEKEVIQIEIYNQFNIKLCIYNVISKNKTI